MQRVNFGVASGVVLNRVGRLDVERDRLAGESLYKDLHLWVRAEAVSCEVQKEEGGVEGQ